MVQVSSIRFGELLHKLIDLTTVSARIRPFAYSPTHLNHLLTPYFPVRRGWHPAAPPRHSPHPLRPNRRSLHHLPCFPWHLSRRHRLPHALRQARLLR